MEFTAEEKQLVRQLQNKYRLRGGRRYSGPEKIATYLRSRLLTDEVVLVLYLDAKLRLLGSDTFTSYHPDYALSNFRRIARQLLFLNAAGMVVAHNHLTSNSSHPSPPDRRFTKSLLSLAKHLDVDLIDHVIVGESSWYSFLQEGKLA